MSPLSRQTRNTNNPDNPPDWVRERGATMAAKTVFRVLRGGGPPSIKFGTPFILALVSKEGIVHGIACVKDPTK